MNGERRGTTLLEMLVVSILLMAVLGTITSFFAFMPRWTTTTTGQISMMREEMAAASLLQGEISRAGACACPTATSAMITNASNGDNWEYYLEPHATIANRYELRTSKDGRNNFIRVAGMVKEFKCITQSQYAGVDMCLVYEEMDGRLRRECVQFRRATARTMEIDIADLDRDGFRDLVTVRPAASQIQTYKGQADGTWVPHVTVSLNADSQPRSIEIVDFDGNGKLDLAVLTNKDVQVLEADPSLVTNPMVNGVMSYTVTQTIVLPTGAAPIALASGDLDNDGATDLVATDAAIKAVRLLYGQTTNKLRFNSAVRWPVSPSSLPGIPRRVRVGFMNAGTVRDLVIGLNSPNVARESVVVAMGSGDRSTYFGTPTRYVAGDESWDLDIGDIDNDGDLDVISADWTRDRLALLTNGGSGTLSAPSYTTTVSPTAVAFLEWNGVVPRDIASVTRVRGTATAVHVFPGPSLGTTVSTVNFPSTGVDGISIVTANVSATQFDTWAAAWMTPDPGGVRFETSPVEKPIFRDLALGDVNRDGRDDLVMVSNVVSEVTVTPGTGSGTFTDSSKVSFPLPGGTSALAVRLADVDRDGDLDIVIATETDVQVLRGTGAATITSSSFGAATSFAAGTQPFSLALGDFNRDGIPDAAVTDAGQARVSVLLGNGSGGFGSPSHITLSQASFPVAILDLDRDGVEDLVIGHRTGANVLSLLIGNGTGGFGAPTVYAAGAASDALAVADLTRDGIPDVVTAERAASIVRVIPGTSTGTLNTGAVATVSTQSPVALAALRFNADPFPDIAVVNKLSGTPSQVTMLLGSGTTPWLTAQTPTAIGTNGAAIAAGNLVRDGRDDWVAAWTTGTGNYTPGLATTQTRAGTLNLTGRVELNLATGSERRRLTGVVAGDFDRDGRGDVATVTEHEQGGDKSGVISFFGNGGLTFTGAVHQRIANNIVQMIDLADINRDGKLDLLASQGGTSPANIYLPTGSANRSAPWDSGGAVGTWAPGGVPGAPTSIDYNRDGRVDYLAATSTLYAVGKADGTGGAPTVTSSYALTSVNAITAGDLDRNGYPDLLAVVSAANQLRVRLHNGTANDNPYPAESASYAMASGSSAVALGDFNLDGILDVVTANGASNNLTVRTGTSSGTFNAIGAGQTIATANNPRRVRVADMNMDGKPDLVACGDGTNTTNGKVWISIGNGDGTFQAATAYTVAFNPWDIRVFDFNQDDRPDIAVSHNTDQTSGGNPVARVWVIPGTNP